MKQVIDAELDKFVNSADFSQRPDIRSLLEAALPVSVMQWLRMMQKHHLKSDCEAETDFIANGFDPIKSMFGEGIDNHEDAILHTWITSITASYLKMTSRSNFELEASVFLFNGPQQPSWINTRDSKYASHEYYAYT